MKILLVGEYSRMHNSLKEGLQRLGHEVTLVGNGDDFKRYPVDANIDGRLFKHNFILNAIRQGVFRIFKKDLAQYETALRFWRRRREFSGFDVVQLINEWSLQTPPHIEQKLLGYLFKNNKKSFLVSCGDDYTCVSYMLSGKFRYSVLTPFDRFPDDDAKRYTLQYATKPFKQLHDFVYENIEGVVAGDIDYYLPLKNELKFKGLIGYAVNLEKHRFSPLKTDGRLVIFHGINQVNYHKKGNYIFEEALAMIGSKYGDDVEIITTRNVPYAQYIESYNRAHIILDQVFAYDQGYNALEAMARGKVVFTGAETEFMDFYRLEQRVAVNALPDAAAIASELEFLIEHPGEMVEMGKRARQFVESHHDHVAIAQRYLKTWAGETLTA